MVKTVRGPWRKAGAAAFFLLLFMNVFCLNAWAFGPGTAGDDGLSAVSAAAVDSQTDYGMCAGAALPADVEPASGWGGEELLDDFDLSQIESFLESGGSQISFSFRELMMKLIQGDFQGVFHECLVSLKQALFHEISVNGKWIAQVMILGLVGAVFANFSSIFSNSQIAETGFYVTYLLMFTFLASSFLTGISITRELLNSMLEFMRALLPAYFLAVSFAGGSLTSAAGYGWMLFSIGLVQWAFLRLFMPLIRIYILFALAGHMVKEDIFSRITELLESGIRWGLKTTAGVVLGFHLLQNMVVPYADSLKNTSLQRMVSVIPGLGQGASAVSQMVLGAGVLLKNTMGAGAVIVLIVISLIPLMKLALFCLFYQGAAAILQPVCDKRMVSCISAVGDGCRLLLSMAATALLLFGISLAIVCIGANATYFSG